MDLTKSSMISEINRCILATNIFEYDISNANACALKLLKGDDLYNELIALPKEERVIRVGNMMKEDKLLFNQIESLIIQFRNQFIEINKIKKDNIIEITRDSVMIKNTVPTITTLPDYPFVNFSTKGEEYSSYIYIDHQKRILYDSMRGKIRIKGINQEVVNNSKFVKKILKPSLKALEDKITIGFFVSYKAFLNIKNIYLNSEDYDIYRDLTNNNQLLYQKYDSEIYSDILIEGEENNIIKSANYINFILPLIKIIL